MATPVKIDSVVDVTTHEPINIASVDQLPTESEDGSESLSEESVDRLTALILAVIIFTITLALKHIM